MRQTTRRHDRGFTLVELMIVVGLIGVLAALAIPNYVRFTAKANRSEMLETVSKMKLTFKGFYDNLGTMSTAGTLPASASSLVNPPSSTVGVASPWNPLLAGWTDFQFPPEGNVKMRYSYTMGDVDAKGNVSDVIIVACGSFPGLGAQVVTCPGSMLGNYRYTEVFHGSGASEAPVEFPAF